MRLKANKPNIMDLVRSNVNETGSFVRPDLGIGSTVDSFLLLLQLKVVSEDF